MPELLRSAKLAVEKGQAQGRNESYVKQLSDYVVPALVEALHKVIVVLFKISCGWAPPPSSPPSRWPPTPFPYLAWYSCSDGVEFLFIWFFLRVVKYLFIYFAGTWYRDLCKYVGCNKRMHTGLPNSMMFNSTTSIGIQLSCFGIILHQIQLTILKSHYQCRIALQLYIPLLFSARDWQIN